MTSNSVPAPKRIQPKRKLQQLATKRINEIWFELRGWNPKVPSMDLEILAIKRYLDELAEEGIANAR